METRQKEKARETRERGSRMSLYYMKWKEKTDYEKERDKGFDEMIYCIDGNEKEE